MVFNLNLFDPLIFEIFALAILMEHMFIGLVDGGISVGGTGYAIKLGPMLGKFAKGLVFLQGVLEDWGRGC